jgi:2-polyprenyl-6-methoxyphenol hydroxylase-like FAD-dependent oxidoreductase
LTTAIALCRRRFAPELVERSGSWRADGAAIVIQPNAMRVLRSLGVGTDIEKAGVTPRRFKFLSREGDVLCELDLTALWSSVGSGAAVERGELQKALLRSVGNARCRLGVWVTSLRQRDGFVSVDFSDRRSGDYELVIGADGIGSTVRSLAVSKAVPRYCGQMAWRSLAPTRANDPDEIQFWLGDGCFFTRYAPWGLTRVFWLLQWFIVHARSSVCSVAACIVFSLRPLLVRFRRVPAFSASAINDRKIIPNAKIAPL